MVDGIFGRFSPGIIRIYLLLEDGTVQKYNFDYFEAGNFKADSAIENVKDIVKLETIINDGGKPLAIAIDKYGYYYTLN